MGKGDFPVFSGALGDGVGVAAADPREEDDVEAPESSEEQQQRTSINSQNVSVAYSTNAGYAASQQGV